MVMTLKKQLSETCREKNKLQSELEQLKKGKKACVFNELIVQLESYAEECKRMRFMLEDSLANQNDQHRQIEKLQMELNEAKKAPAEKEQLAQQDACQFESG